MTEISPSSDQLQPPKVVLELGFEFMIDQLLNRLLDQRLLLTSDPTVGSDSEQKRVISDVMFGFVRLELKARSRG